MKSINLLILTLVLISASCQRDKVDSVETLGGINIPKPKLSEFIETQMAKYKVPGLAIAILNKGELAFANTFGVISMDNPEKIEKNAIFEAASLSKPVFAYFTMMQIDKGLIDLDTPLYNYVSYEDLQHDERFKSITPRIVLSHTTGLPNWRRDTLNFEFDPGVKYGYSGEGFQYLARALAKVNNVGTDGLFQIFTNEITEPLGAKRFYFNWNNDIEEYKVWGHKNGKVTDNKPSDFRKNEFGSAHNLHTDIGSYANFIRSIISGENVSQETQTEFLKAQVSIPEDDYENAVLGNTHWSLGFGMKKTANGWRYSHGGNNGDFTSFVIFYPVREFALILFSNSEKIMFSNFTNEIASFLQTDLHMDMEKLKEILSKYE